MIVSSLIFFDATIHTRIIFKNNNILTTSKANVSFKPKQYILPLFISFFIIQIFLPFRYLTYPGELFWNEQGYRFSWRVMLMEKKGYTTFKIKDSINQKIFLY